MRITSVFLLCCAIGVLGGCAERKARAFPWATAVLAKPKPPATHDPSAVAAADIAPDFRIEPPSNLGKILAVRPGPVAPRSRTQNSAAGESANGSKSSLLVPQLSPQETTLAKEQFSQGVAVAERNLAAARGKRLTPGQQDAISKINAFLLEAREAAGEGDWARARNLAKKAQILSEDLAGSL
ncbi:MAG TPA: hypothetical protein VKD70_04730 [Candidatus Acidoferrum sp.]|nr:hypothetical protein [Candidatus Acidoferrum sp.]